MARKASVFTYLVCKSCLLRLLLVHGSYDCMQSIPTYLFICYIALESTAQRCFMLTAIHSYHLHRIPTTNTVINIYYFINYFNRKAFTA